MARQAAVDDRRAAEYWRSVAQADRSEARSATANARVLASAARREDYTPVKTQRRAQRVQQ